MISRVAQRGHSHVGAGKYYLHDKRGVGETTRDSSDRVVWTHTHNLPTQDPDRAMKWMAFTSMNADGLKKNAGVSMCGRKATAGPVYAFSLAWHPDQNPQREEMEKASFSALEKLGLLEHQAILVAHDDTDHDHVHVICNLVHPLTGKTASVGNDQVKLSKWSEEYERTHGKIYCEQRVENNREREKLADEKKREERKAQRAAKREALKKAKAQGDAEKERQAEAIVVDNGRVTHRAERMERFVMIQELYNRSDGGVAFRAALKEQGYTLARGDRRGFVIVDDAGKVHSLSRQLKGQRAKDLKARFTDLQDLTTLQQLKEEEKAMRQSVIKEREIEPQPEVYDRDAAEVRRQGELSDAGMEAAQKADPNRRGEDRGGRRKKTTKAKNQPVAANENAKVPEKTITKRNPDILEKMRGNQKHRYRSLAEQYDPYTKWSATIHGERLKFEEQLKKDYDRTPTLERLAKLEEQIAKTDTFFGRTTGRLKKLKVELGAERKGLANLDGRIEEARSAHEILLLERYPEPEIRVDGEREQEERKEALKRKFDQAVPDQGRGDVNQTPTPSSEKQSPREERGPEL